MNSIDTHPARFGNANKQQIQLLQRIGHSWQKAAFRPSLSRRHFGFSAFTVLVNVQEKRAQPSIEVGRCELRLSAHAATSRCVAGELTQKHLVYRPKESLDAPAASGLAWNGEDQPDFEIRADLLQMTGSKVAAVIGVQHLRDTANRPARILFAPDGLT